MRLYLIVLPSFFLATRLYSQNYDANWVFGVAPIERIHFFQDSIVHFQLSTTLETFNGNASISNKNGDFLFYTNGIHVANKLGNLMPHGDSLSFYNPSAYSVIYSGGAPQDQGTLIIPKPGDTSIY